MSFLRLQCQDFLKERSVKKIHLFIYLFIYLFIINFAKRPGSLTEEAPLRGPERRKKKRKLVIQRARMKNTLETTKKKLMQKPNW